MNKGQVGIHSNAAANGSGDTLHSTHAPKVKPGAFRRILGAVAGGLGNVALPGIGGIIGGWISGNGRFPSALGNEATQFLELQRRISAENRAFELVSTLLKIRHDASMTAIRNMSSR